VDVGEELVERGEAAPDQHTGGRRGGKQQPTSSRQVAPAPYRERQYQKAAVVDAVNAVARRGDRDRPVALPDADPGTRRPPHCPNDMAVGDPAALVHRTDHVRDVHRTRPGPVQGRLGQWRPHPARRPGPGMPGLAKAGNHRRDNGCGHRDHP
jgi:hypothetical protein